MKFSYNFSAMSLPPTYSSSTQYLKDVLAFLQVHQWIYNFPNTHILAQDVLKHIPIDWQQHFSKFPSDIKHIVDSKFKVGIYSNLSFRIAQYIIKYFSIKFLILSFCC